jgi:hypothetical protein
MNGHALSPSLSKRRIKYQVSRTKRRINEDIVDALLAGGSIGEAERAETKCRLLITYKKYGLEQKDAGRLPVICSAGRISMFPFLRVFLSGHPSAQQRT